MVDDASEDDIQEVVARYRDPRVRCIRRSVNGGVAAAQNTGIDHAHGEFVAFLHSDDEFFPTKLERQVELFARSPDTIGAVESAIEVVWPDSVECWPPGFEGADASDVLAYRARVHISGLLVRRRAVAAQLRFDEQLRGAEDRDFCIRLLQSTHLAFSPEPLSRVSKAETGESALAPEPRTDLCVPAGEVPRRHRRRSSSARRLAVPDRPRVRPAGQMPEARQALQRSVRLDPARARRWLLWLASFGGDGVYGAASRIQVRLAQAARPRAVYSSAHD